MGEQDALRRILASLYDAVLDDTRWPAAFARIDEACGIKGNALMVGDARGTTSRATFVGLYSRGQRREDLEREYLEHYHPTDERVPRVRQLPDSRLVHVTDLLTVEERKTSPTYNEALPRADPRNGLVVPLDGPDGSHISWGLGDPVDSGGWTAWRVAMVTALLPHVRRFVAIRQALVRAEARKTIVTRPARQPRVGVLHLDRRGPILEVNDRARGILRNGDGLSDRDGALRARAPADHERSRRRWAAAESLAIGYGGDAVVSSATGLARETIRKGRREIARDEAPTDRIRRPGGGRPRIQQDQPGIQAALEALVDPLTRGDPTSPLRWTCKSRAKLAAALTEQGWRVSSTTVGRLLHRLGYRLQSPRKRQEGATHPDRNAQFEHINRTADEHLSAGQPVISVDTKKKELVGNFKNGGREWQPKGTPPAVLVHDFPTDAEGKAIPYGVYDMARNEAFVSVGWDHDTPAFAVASIRQCWHQMGCDAYPEATTLFITADAGGSNGYRLHAWKHELQQLADETGLTIEVSHFPPGTSKWNKIEHRLFCHITANWRGTPLTTYETIVDRIGNVRTETGL